MSGLPPALRRLRRLIPFVLAALATALVCGFSYRALVSPEAIGRDILQPYLMAAAISQNQDPYQPRSALTERHLGVLLHIPEDNPPAYTPFAGVLFIPLSKLPLPIFNALWVILSALFCFGAAALLLRDKAPEGRSMPLILAAWGLLILSFAGSDELRWGQFGMLLLLLLAFAWRSLGAGRNWMAGACLGVCFSLKLLFLPLVCYFVLKRQWKWVLGFLLTAAACSAGALLVAGAPAHRSYLRRVLPEIQANWGNEVGNYSIPAAVLRFTAPPMVRPAEPGVAAGRLPHSAQPPFSRSALLFANCLSLALVITVLWRALRDHSAELAAARLVLISLVAPPVSWPHYGVMLLLPAVLFYRAFAGNIRALLLPALCAAALLEVNFGAMAWRSISWFGPSQSVFPLPVPSAILASLPAALYLVIALVPSPRIASPARTENKELL